MLKNELEIKSVKGNENNIATLALRKYVQGEGSQSRTNKNHIVTGKQIGRAHV